MGEGYGADPQVLSDQLNSYFKNLDGINSTLIQHSPEFKGNLKTTGQALQEASKQAAAQLQGYHYQPEEQWTGGGSTNDNAEE